MRDLTWEVEVEVVYVYVSNLKIKNFIKKRSSIYKNFFIQKLWDYIMSIKKLNENLLYTVYNKFVCIYVYKYIYIHIYIYIYIVVITERFFDVAIEIGLSGIWNHDKWIPFRRSNDWAIQLEQRTKFVQLLQFYRLVQCHISFPLLTSSVTTFVLI